MAYIFYIDRNVLSEITPNRSIRIDEVAVFLESLI